MAQTKYKKMQKIKIFFLLAALVMSFNIQAQELPERPNPPRLVNDLTGMLTQREYVQLESKLEEFARQTSTQIGIVTVKDLNGNDISSYAFALAEKWGFGKKGMDNGILILIKPKNQQGKGKITIATGYGVEQFVPDATANQIIDKEILPYFQKGAYFKGLDRATTVLMGLTKGEFTSDYYSKRGKKSRGTPWGFLFPLIIVLIFSAIGRSKGRRHYNMTGHGSSLPFWMLMGMMGSGNRRHQGYFDDFSSGGGGFGAGDNFGDFGGFGGGSFGGGGASGEW